MHANPVVGAVHDFHDDDYSQEWADRFRSSPPRRRLFQKIQDLLETAALPGNHIVELGVGPGYLADYLLQGLDGYTYQGLDFSKSMLEIAGKRLSTHPAHRVALTQVDLTEPGWIDALDTSPGAMISTWALHDLGSPERIAAVYRGAYQALPKGGMLLNGDFVKPDETPLDFEPGRILCSEHLHLLERAGFGEPRCLLYLERELEAPTASHNYALFQAVR